MSQKRFRQHRPLYPNTLPPAIEKPKFQWKLLPILWLTLKRVAMTIGFVVLVNLFIAITIIPALIPKEGSAPSLPNEMVLFITFADGFLEMATPATFSDPFAGSSRPVHTLVDASDLASAAARVTGTVDRMYVRNLVLTPTNHVHAASHRVRD